VIDCGLPKTLKVAGGFPFASLFKQERPLLQEGAYFFPDRDVTVTVLFVVTNK
jgi:hypothetical protein